MSLASSQRFVRGCHRTVLSLVLLLFPALISAQTATEYEIKAAYLYNFAKATEWPAEVLPRPDSALVIGVFGGNEDFVRVLRGALSGKSINGHPVKVKYTSTPADLKSCQVVFFRAFEPKNGEAVGEVMNSNVLLVGEDPNFLAQGGMINLVLRDGRVTFEINPSALEHSEIHYGQDRSFSAPTTGPTISSTGNRSTTSQRPPDYPDIAKSMGLKGTVQLQAIVKPDGTVREVHVLGGHPMLAVAAEQAVRRWRYSPANRETVETVKIVFGE